MGKKSKVKNPTVSIITINQIKRQETIILTAEHISNQTYKNIIEWVIVEGSRNLEDCLSNEKFINQLKSVVPIVYIPGYSILDGIPIFNENHLGELRNISNRSSKGDILVCFDDDDYYPKTRVEHCVKMLTNSKAEIAGCSEKYLYDFCLGKLLKFKLFGPNHSTNDCFAYKRSYLENNSYDHEKDNAEESSFTKTFTNPMVQLDAKHCIVGSSHDENTFNKREIVTFSSLWKNPSNPSEGMMYPQTVDILETVVDLIDQEMLDRYTSIFIKNEESEFDISYLCGGTSIEWDPTDQSLGGSEQAVVNLCNEWVKMGKKVAVYGKINCVGIFNGVHFIDWKNFPFNQQHKVIVLWRMSGVNCYLPFPIKTRKLFVDYHDNNFVFRHSYLPFTDRIDKIFFKSNFHLEEYQRYFKLTLKPEQYNIIPNGIRVSNFGTSPQVTREPFRFCYCSCYTRGLIDLLKYVWPIIFREYPQAELHCYYGMVGLDQQLKQQLMFLMGQPGVMDHSRRPVEEIVLEKWKSTFQLYITDCTGEIDCISIRESLVTGCIPLISNSGVFQNRDGLHFNLVKTPQEYYVIAQRICSLLKKPEFLEMCRQRFMKSPGIVDWKTIAERWVEFM